MHVSIHWTQVAPAARQPIVTRLWFCHAMEWKCVMNDETSRQIERQIHTQTHFGRRFWYRCWACNGFPSISSIVLLPLHGFTTEHMNYNRKCKPYMYRIWVNIQPSFAHERTYIMRRHTLDNLFQPFVEEQDALHRLTTSRFLFHFKWKFVVKYLHDFPWQ